MTHSERGKKKVLWNARLLQANMQNQLKSDHGWFFRVGMIINVNLDLVKLENKK